MMTPRNISNFSCGDFDITKILFLIRNISEQKIHTTWKEAKKNDNKYRNLKIKMKGPF